MSETNIAKLSDIALISSKVFVKAPVVKRRCDEQSFCHYYARQNEHTTQNLEHDRPDAVGYDLGAYLFSLRNK